jgi:hypothetical protein
MTDEPPTEPLEPREPPTQKLPSAAGSSATETPARRRRGLLLAILIVLILLLAAGIAVVIVLLGQQSSPVGPTSAPATATDTPPPPPVTSPPPAASGGGVGGGSDDNGGGGDDGTTVRPKPSPTLTADGAPVFTSFDIPNATCTDGNAGSTSDVTIQYTSVGATEAYFGINVANAKEAPSAGPLPANGPFTFTYQCSNSPQTWVITLVDGAGGTTNKSDVVYLHDPE